MSFSFGAFGAAKTTAPATTAGTTSLFSFVPKPVTSTPALSGPGSSLFAAVTQKPFSFAPAATPSAFTNVFGGQQATQPATPATTQLAEADIQAKSITAPQLFNDQRDTAITKWNQLQLLYGEGTVYCGPNHQAKVAQTNEYASFKSFTYGTKPIVSNDSSIVVLLLKKRIDEVHKNRQNIIDTFHRMFENNPNVSIKIEGLKPLPTDTTELRFRVVESQPAFGLSSGLSMVSERNVPASDVIRYVETIVQKSTGATQSLTGFSFSSTPASVNWRDECEKLGFLDMFPEESFSSSEIEIYLNNPPLGISAALWKQANAENPDPSSLIPIPLIGLQAVKIRLSAQGTEAQIQRDQIRKLEQQIQTIVKNSTVFVNRQRELHRCSQDLNHRILEILAFLNNKTRQGASLSTNEEALYARVNDLLQQMGGTAKGTPVSRVASLKDKLANLGCIWISEAGLANMTEILFRLQGKIEHIYKRVYP